MEKVMPPRRLPPIESLDDPTLRSILTRNYIPKGGWHNRRDPVFLQALDMTDGIDVQARNVYQELRRLIDAMAAADWRADDIDQARLAVELVVGYASERIDEHLSAKPF